VQASTSDILDTDTDVLVIGGTAAGCSAAIAAAREGSRVVVLEPTQSIGGVSANGVHCFDVGSRQALSGTAEEFTRRVLDHYERIGLHDTMLHSRADVFWEFHVAERIWRAMVAEYDSITFINGAVPVGAIVNEGRIEAVQWEPAADAIGNPPPEALAKPNHVRAKVVIDASYEGDVAAWAGAKYDLGREARSPAEPHAGVIHTATHERRVNAMGYLPDTILPGSSGAASDDIMSFTARLSLRYAEHDECRKLVPRPDSYNPGTYAWKAPALSPDGRPEFGFDLIPTVNGKMLLNQREKGNDVAKGTRDYITAHPRERTAIRKRMFDHILGFLHFIQTEGGMPQLALAEDEYPGNGNVPFLLYVREGRRFRGRDRLTEANINPFLERDDFSLSREGDSRIG
jgi:ribulose 1,5-bisphosphate synthetase/thiazole synthase